MTIAQRYEQWRKKPQSYKTMNPFHKWFSGIESRDSRLPRTQLETQASDWLKENKK